jgi:hypothetical protein
MAATSQAMVIGVPAPEPITSPGRGQTFRPLPGVLRDVRWYASVLEEQLKPRGSGHVNTYLGPDETSAAYLEVEIPRMLRLVPPGGLFVLVAIGHGTQVPDIDGDEPSGSDQAFVTSRGALTDDFFRDLWVTRPDVNVLTFADVCHADTMLLYAQFPDESKRLRLVLDGLDVVPTGALRGVIATDLAQRVRPVLVRTATTAPKQVDIETSAPAPARLMFAASQQDESAWEDAGGGRFTSALRDAWERPEARTSYEAWFDLARARVIGQRPTLRYRGPERLLRARPFSVPPAT